MSRPGDFWSRRKAKVAEEEHADLRAAEAAEHAAREADLAEKSDEDILEELGLPDPDTLEAGADFKAFMAKAVPDRIRRRALRRLWVSNPALANLDGLLDYGEDFTDSAKVIENLQTAYQVGKGMLAHVEELARQEAQPDVEESAGDDAASDPVVAETAPPAADEAILAGDVGAPETALAHDTVLVASGDEDAQHPDAAPHEDWAPAPRRRMQFRFDDQPQGAAG